MNNWILIKRNGSQTMCFVEYIGTLDSAYEAQSKLIRFNKGVTAADVMVIYLSDDEAAGITIGQSFGEELFSKYCESCGSSVLAFINMNKAYNLMAKSDRDNIMDSLAPNFKKEQHDEENAYHDLDFVPDGEDTEW